MFGHFCFLVLLTNDPMSQCWSFIISSSKSCRCRRRRLSLERSVGNETRNNFWTNIPWTMTSCSVQVLGDESNKSQHIAASHGMEIPQKKLYKTNTKHKWIITIEQPSFGTILASLVDMSSSWWLASGGNIFQPPPKHHWPRVPVTTRTIAFLVGNSYKPLPLATGVGHIHL